MAKKAIFWTVANRPHSSCGVEVVAVTSEKPGRMIYGRDRDGMSTHRHPRDCHGRFPSPELAQAAIKRVEAVIAEHAPMIRHAERALWDTRHNRDRALELLYRQFDAEHPTKQE